jgi:hypothetical protein
VAFGQGEEKQADVFLEDAVVGIGHGGKMAKAFAG